MESVRIDLTLESLNKSTIPSMTFHATNHQEHQAILLDTVRILAADASGKYCSARAVINTWSQISTITGPLASRFRLQVTQSPYQVIGIVGCRSLLRSRIHKCLTCARFNTTKLQPTMGTISAARVTPSRPFNHVGIDFAGSFKLKFSNCRHASISKGYLCMFVPPKLSI